MTTIIKECIKHGEPSCFLFNDDWRKRGFSLGMEYLSMDHCITITVYWWLKSSQEQFQLQQLSLQTRRYRDSFLVPNGGRLPCFINNCFRGKNSVQILGPYSHWLDICTESTKTGDHIHKYPIMAALQTAVNFTFLRRVSGFCRFGTDTEAVGRRLI